jgi:hypothetical protein
MLQRFAPVFVLDKKEPYWPSSIGDYIKNCRVVTTSNPKKVILETVKDPREIMKFDSPDASLELKTDDKGRREGIRNRKFYPGQLEVYGYERLLKYSAPDGSDGMTAYDLAYVLWFPYNGTLSPHVSDREYVVIRVRDNRPVAVYFSNHQGGYWKKWEDVKTRDGKLLVYVSKESHAFYHKPGMNYRILGFGNDPHTPGEELTPARYTLVSWTKTPKDRPWVVWRGGRGVGFSTRPMLVDGQLAMPNKSCAVTDYPALINTKLSKGLKYALTIGFILLILLAVGLGLGYRKPWVVLLALPPTVGATLMWVILTSTVEAATLTSLWL